MLLLLRAWIIKKDNMFEPEIGRFIDRDKNLKNSSIKENYNI